MKEQEITSRYLVADDGRSSRGRIVRIELSLQTAQPRTFEWKYYPENNFPLTASDLRKAADILDRRNNACPITVPKTDY